MSLCKLLSFFHSILRVKGREPKKKRRGGGGGAGGGCGADSKEEG